MTGEQKIAKMSVSSMGSYQTQVASIDVTGVLKESYIFATDCMTKCVWLYSNCVFTEYAFYSVGEALLVLPASKALQREGYSCPASESSICS